MRLRDRRQFTKPEVMIIPMIDIMFFLLVFFMISTLYMVDLKTVGVDLPQAVHAEAQTKVNYVVTMKKDGTLWLEDKEISRGDLVRQAAEAQRRLADEVGPHHCRRIDRHLVGPGPQYLMEIVDTGDAAADRKGNVDSFSYGPDDVDEDIPL